MLYGELYNERIQYTALNWYFVVVGHFLVISAPDSRLALKLADFME